jgi:hypothetical protein
MTWKAQDFEIIAVAHLKHGCRRGEENSIFH